MVLMNWLWLIQMVNWYLYRGIQSWTSVALEIRQCASFKRCFLEGGSMERLPENTILKYNQDTLAALRKEYSLDKPGQMNEAIDLLDAWVKRQRHFVRKDFPREYLERVIILLKGSVERAKAQLDKICTLRTLLPQYFEKCDARNDLKITLGISYKALLPKLTRDHVRILFCKYIPAKYTSKILLYEYFYNVLVCEYIKAHDYSNGIAMVIDVRDVNLMDLVSQLNVIEMKQICTIFLEGYDTRTRNFFFLSTSKTIDVTLKVFRQMISEKLRNRIHIFKEVQELHEHISKELLPADYGGCEKPMTELNDELIQELSSEDNVAYFKEMSKVRTIESLRTSTKYNQDFLGTDGSFRSLSFD